LGKHVDRGFGEDPRQLLGTDEPFEYHPIQAALDCAPLKRLKTCAFPSELKRDLIWCTRYQRCEVKKYAEPMLSPETP
jgi:hypothetical protein